jgi:DNA-binding response OmpR family regulator
MSTLVVERRSVDDSDTPTLADGVLRRGRSTVILSFTEERLMALLLESQPMLVSRADAAHHTGHETGTATRAFDSLVARLRRKLVGTGITIRSERLRGLGVELSRPPGADRAID